MWCRTGCEFLQTKLLITHSNVKQPKPEDGAIEADFAVPIPFRLKQKQPLVHQ